MLNICCAINTSSGSVAKDKRVDVPTHCAEYSGAISYSSANILVVLADGIAEHAVIKSTQKSDNPISFRKMQKNRGIMISLNAHR